MCLGISSFDNVNNSAAMTGAASADSCSEIASGFSLGSIFGGMFSNGNGSSKNIEGTATVACLFGDNLSLDSNGAEAGGEVLFGGFSGGGSCGGGGGISLA